MATIAQLVDELERSYRETHERMSDPAVYNDHREVAEAGRRLKELEEPFKLAEVVVPRAKETVWSRQATYPSVAELADATLVIVWTDLSMSDTEHMRDPATALFRGIKRRPFSS